MKNLIRITSLLLCLFILTACSANNAAPTAAPVATIATTITAASTPGEIKNIILIIGDGMGDAQIEVGELAKGQNFVFHDWQRTHANTNSLDSYGQATKVTDSAAGGTALSTGTLTTNKYVGKDSDSNDLKTIIDYAKEYGKATGVVTTDTIFGATPAAFSGHSVDREDYVTILYSQLESNADLLCADASSKSAEMKSFYEKAGYTYCDKFASISETLDSEKAYWQFDMAGTSAQDKLEEVVTYALDFLDKDADGFVMMIEQAHIDKYCHSNDIEGTQLMSNSLNNTVEAILEWMGDRTDTAIIITADHETGDLRVNTEKKYPTKYEFGSSTIYYMYGSESHSDAPVSVYVYGFTADFTPYYIDDTQEVIKNISVFEIMLDLLQNPIR